jgi:predicted molibdopterin-dependent oxidoreductase YjgC
VTAGRGEVTFEFEGTPVHAQAGDTVAMALWRNGVLDLRHSSRDGEPRGMLCAMGICFECLVRVGETTVRACMLPVQEGLRVKRGGRP